MLRAKAQHVDDDSPNSVFLSIESTRFQFHFEGEPMANITIPASLTYYLFYIENAGHYCQTGDDGRRCLYVFSSPENVRLFSLTTDHPQAECAAEEYSINSLIDFLNDRQDYIQLLEFDNDGSTPPSPVLGDAFMSNVCFSFT